MGATQILQQRTHQPIPEDSNRREDSKSNNESLYITPQEAEQHGIRLLDNPPPKSEVCQFCGKEIPPRGALISNDKVIWIPIAPRCDCPEAKAFWEIYDAQRKAEEEAIQLDAERKRNQARFEKLLGKSGIKKRFQQRTFENFVADTPERTRAYKIAKRYADTFSQRYLKGDGLYMEGTNGTGKTHLAAAIALQLISEGVSVICKTSIDLLRDIKKAYEDEYTKESVILDAYKSVDLLIIDDLGKEQCTDWGISNLYDILNDRYEDMKPTIITTNYGADDLINALTPKGFDNTKATAIISRLRETSIVITMAWTDFRTEQE